MKVIQNVMNKQPLIAFFQKNSYMSLAVIMHVIDYFEERRFSKNEFFLKEGKVCDFLYLAEGLMRAYKFDLKGNEVTTNFFAGNRHRLRPCFFFSSNRL